MASRKLQKKIQSVLTSDETIEANFRLRDCEVYATNKRLLELKGRSVRDYDYAHISSIQYTSKRYRSLIVLGTIFLIAGVSAAVAVAPALLALAGIGLIFIIAGIFKKSEWVELYIVGVSDSRRYKGSKDALDSLLRIVRQKRLSGPTSGQKETRAVDFTETIRKLAELRDQGIITEDEFEQKKGKLLRNSD